MIEVALIMACAPNVHHTTIKEIIRVENLSQKPLAININTKNGRKLKPKIKITTVHQAVAVTNAAIAYGHTVDMGYMQVNSANLKRLGYTVRDMFNPCKNIKAGAKIFEEAYLQELPKHKTKQGALLAALSIYNTGNNRSGFRNGYVAKYTGHTKLASR